MVIKQDRYDNQQVFYNRHNSWPTFSVIKTDQLVHKTKSGIPACMRMYEREIEGLSLVKNWLNAYIGSLYQEVNRLPENIQDFL